VESCDVASDVCQARGGGSVGGSGVLSLTLVSTPPSYARLIEDRQGLTLVHVRAELEQLQDTFRIKLGRTVDRRGQVELKSERV
jgi:hypothetical protein